MDFSSLKKKKLLPLPAKNKKRFFSRPVMTADTVFLFQEVGKLLNCRVIGLTFALFIESALQVHQ